MLVCGLAVFLTASANAAQDRVAGRILAAKVRGTVTALHKADNATRELHDNDAVSEGYVVTTAAKSSVVLLFANGSAVNLGADSSLSIDEFLMDPFDPKYSVGDAKEEPSTSVTTLSLARGEMVGNVKHLHRENGSSYTVKTPVGAAGIRGTTFQLTLGTNSEGKMTVTLSTSEGVVAFINLNGAEQLVPAGKRIEMQFDVFSNDPQGRTGVIPGSIRITGLRDMSAATQAAIAHAVEEILRDRTGTIDTSNAPDATRPTEDTTPGDGRSPSRG